MEQNKLTFPAFRVNQTGYAACLPVHAAALTDRPVTLWESEGKEILRIGARKPALDAASGDAVRLLRLGTLKPGTYILEAGEEKRAFTVSSDPWRTAVNALIKGLYFQRCGCGLEAAHAGKWAHPACHTGVKTEWEARSVRRRITGGWHDAGDYGRYVSPGAVAAAHLLYAWKLFPAGCSDELNIPETGNGVPDILNEARYELEWLLGMQRGDGAFYHKLTKASFAPFIMPQDDKKEEYLMPVSHCATGAACACLALGSRIFRAFDPAFAGQMLSSAVSAWRWLEAHPDFVPFRNPEGVRTGQYGDGSDNDERFWAACELFAATHETGYRNAAEKYFSSLRQLTQFGWADVSGLGAVCCLFELGEEAGSILYGRLKPAFIAQCEKALELSSNAGYGTSLPPDRYVWGSIMPIMNHAFAMILCAELTGRSDMRDAALLQWHYALGMNALDLCFVTGLGERSVQFPHHRPSGADGIAEPVPGLIAGGPNKCFPYPATREKLGENTPPAKYYLDETPSADTNEIAVYWNSVTILTGAYFAMLCITGH